MRVLSIGECMAEMAPAEVAGTFRLGFAGDTFNTAWYLARAGLDVAYFTALGDDPLSHQMRDFMAAAGVGTTHLRVVPGGTVGLYLVSLQDGERSFSYWRGQSAARHLADDAAALQAAMSEADMIYTSGITLAILEPAARVTLLQTLRQARQQGARVAFDPNLRPRLWPDPDTMRAAVAEAAGVCDIALPSHEDEAVWFGDADPDATAARYAQAGAGTVLVKNGAADILWRQNDARGEVPVRPVPAVDTTAAGDSFNAGFLAGVAAGETPADAVARGRDLAAMVVQGRGALVSTGTSPKVP